MVKENEGVSRSGRWTFLGEKGESTNLSFLQGLLLVSSREKETNKYCSHAVHTYSQSFLNTVAMKTLLKARTIKKISPSGKKGNLLSFLYSKMKLSDSCVLPQFLP